MDKARREEHRHIEKVPGGEREEVRQIFARKGFQGETLDRIVATITDNRELWVDTMVTEELGLPLEGPSPVKAALATFAAFVLVGLVPLLPFLSGGVAHRFWASAAVTAVAFAAVGVMKGLALGRSMLRSGLETLAIGGGAAMLAYFLGAGLRRAFGAV